MLKERMGLCKIYINKETIEAIRSKVSIVSIIENKVNLIRKGKNWLGLCPFHAEKTPSFFVSEERNNYHCFGCGKSGNIFNFIMETEGVGFVDAVKFLADQAGITVVDENAANKFSDDDKEQVTEKSLYEIMTIAKSFFESNMVENNNVAMGYLKRRGYTLEDAEKFELGWSPASYDSLRIFLLTRKITDEQAFLAGLANLGETNKYYDVFRGRIMFPIKDIMGRTVAFGGRTVDGAQTKYLNSKETDIYSKRKVLYLLNMAKNSIKEKHHAILVEGYLDAVRLHLNGWTETVATLGTALTEEQAKLIKRFTNKCYLCFDQDRAGEEATLKSMYILQQAGLDVYVMTLKEKDPDALLLTKDGKHMFEMALKNAVPLVVHHVNTIQSLLNDKRRKDAEEAIFPDISALSDFELSPFATLLANKFDVSVSQFWEHLNEYRKKKKSKKSEETATEEEVIVKMDTNAIQKNNIAIVESAICSFLVDYPQFRSDIDKIKEFISNKDTVQIISDIEKNKTLLAEDIETMWMLEDSIGLISFISAGTHFASVLSEEFTEGKWERLKLELEKNYHRARYYEIRQKLRENIATNFEIMEFQNCATFLKRDFGTGFQLTKNMPYTTDSQYMLSPIVEKDIAVEACNE